MAPNWMKHFNNDPFILFALLLSVCVVILSIILVACVARKSVNEIWHGVRARRNPVPAPATTPRSDGIELRPVSGRRSYRGMPTMQTIEEEPNGEAAASTSIEEQSLEQPVVASAPGSDGVDAGLIAGSQILEGSDDGDSDSPTRRRRQNRKSAFESDRRVPRPSPATLTRVTIVIRTQNRTKMSRSVALSTETELTLNNAHKRQFRGKSAITARTQDTTPAQRQSSTMALSDIYIFFVPP